MCMCGASKFVLVLLVIVLCSFKFGYCKPTLVKREIIEDNVQNYLMQFGYLSQTAEGAGALRTEDSVRQAIKDLQQFGGLPVTGRLDERTIKLLRTPRCGLPDVLPHQIRKKRFMPQGQKWLYTNLTWSLRSKSLQKLDSYEVRFVLMKALEVWSKHSKLTFTEVDSDRADILIYFHKGDHGDNFPFDGKGQVLAHAFFPGSGRGGDAHFDEDEIWLTNEHDDNKEGTSLFHVAAHEFGHSLGLSHSSVEGALMYPWYQEMGKGFDYELPEDDRLGIQSLYGAREDRIWERPKYPYQPPPPLPPRITTPRTTTVRTTERRRPEPPRYPETPPYNPYHPPRPTEKPMYPKKHPMHPDKKPHHPKHKPHSPSQHPTRHHPLDKYPSRHNPTERRHNYPHYTPAERPPERTPERRYPGVDAPDIGGRRLKKPDTCNTSYDAIAVIRREVFIFKDRYFWRLNDSGLLPGYPAEITRMWNGLPSNFTHVDAVYERPDNKIVFFIGRNFYVYIGHMLEQSYPKPLTDLGLPKSLEKIDGATVWGHNGKTFFFSGSMYWRFDEDTRRVELDYPRSMNMWKGVEDGVDAVFQWKDGKTYFFKGTHFWKFNDLRMEVEKKEGTPSAQFWMGCSKNLKEGFEPGVRERYVDISSSTPSNPYSVNFTVVALGLLLSKFYQLIT